MYCHKLDRVYALAVLHVNFQCFQYVVSVVFVKFLAALSVQFLWFDSFFLLAQCPFLKFETVQAWFLMCYRVAEIQLELQNNQ